MSDSTSDPSCIQWDASIVFPLQQFLVNAYMTAFGYGGILILAILVGYTLLRDGFPTGGRRILFIAVAIFFAASSAIFAANLGYFLANIASGPNNEDQAALLLGERTHILEVVASRLCYLLNDAIVVWRAWVVADHILLRALLTVSMLAVTGCTFAEAVINIKATIFQANTVTFNLLLYVPLIANNLLATLIILYMTWRYRTEIKVHLPSGTKKRQVERVLFLLVESGLVYIGWWLFLVLVEFIPGVPLILYGIIWTLTPATTAIYPLLIILIVEHQKAQDANSATLHTHSIRFASSPNGGGTPQTETTFGRSIIQTIAVIQSTPDHDHDPETNWVSVKPNTQNEKERDVAQSPTSESETV